MAVAVLDIEDVATRPEPLCNFYNPVTKVEQDENRCRLILCLM